MMTPTDFERLPDSALAELAIRFEACELYGCWPGQVSLIIGRMLPKKVSGDRIIGLVAMLGRVWSMIREPLVRTWSTATEQQWDAAIRGNPVLEKHSYERYRRRYRISWRVAMSRALCSQLILPSSSSSIGAVDVRRHALVGTTGSLLSAVPTDSEH
eukprot:5828887-Pyramimonas_sp.AAC.1